MGLYQSELSRQIHLRNKQKREWVTLRKKIAQTNEERNSKISQQQELLQQEQDKADQEEMLETETSKKLASSMVSSAANEGVADTLLKVVDILQNQNGKNYLRPLLITYSRFSI